MRWGDAVVKPFSQAGNDLSDRMTKLSTAIKAGNRDTLTAALKVAKAEHLKVISADSGGDLRLSRMGRSGAKVGARYDIVNASGSDVSGKVSKTGPLHILANPTQPHMIPKVRSRGRKRFVVIPGVGVRSSAKHPGTKGKDTWRRGRLAAAPHVGREVSKRTTNVLRKAM